jgi:hypothetical protein
MPILKSIAVWLVIIAVETAHGIVRGLWIQPAIGDMPARQIGVPVACVLNFLVTWLFIRWLRPTAGQALWIGALWVVLTVAFEIGLGLALGLPWARIAQDYDFTQGGLMPLGLLLLGLSPWLALRLRGVPAAS